ncbi:MAG: glycoside hydrolase [Asticcacaulis sp.]
MERTGATALQRAAALSPEYRYAGGAPTGYAPQDAFFRPLHEALATQTLDGFAFLSDDRLVQQTTFADGSRLIANFDSQARQADGHDLPAGSLTALLAGQDPVVYLA